MTEAKQDRDVATTLVLHPKIGPHGTMDAQLTVL